MPSRTRVIEEHDVVRFLAPIDHWPAGTEGTVVSVYHDAMLVELDGEGDCLDLLVTVPAELLEVTLPQGRPRAA